MTESNHDASRTAEDLITVLGGTGGIGQAIVKELSSDGRRVRAVSRSATDRASGAGDPLPTSVDLHDADLMDLHAAVTACAGSTVVVMAAQPPYTHWVSDWPTMLDNVIAGVAAAGARLVFVDNLYAYSPASGTLTEASPEHATDPKGALRARLGQRVLQAHHSGEVRAVIGRFSDYFGPDGDNSGLTMTALRPAAKGKTMRAMIDLDQPHAYHYLPDAARGFVRMVDDAAGDGKVWLLPTHPAVTQRAMMQQVNALLPDPVRIGVFGRRVMWVVGLFDAMLRETRSVVCQFDRPWAVDGSAFEATYGPLPLTPTDQALRATLDSLDGGARRTDTTPADAPSTEASAQTATTRPRLDAGR